MSEEDNSDNNDSSGDSGDASVAVADSGGESLITGVSAEGANPLETWKDSLPVTLKNDPALSSFKDVEGLAKSYVHAQKMVGSERVAVPRDDWTDADWSGYYDKLGRPETHDGYETPDVELPESIKFDDSVIDDAKKEFHKLGLSSKQADGILKYYLSGLGDQVSKQNEHAQETHDQATSRLENEWGREYGHNMDIARGALKKFGTPELIETLESTGMGNNVDLIKAFASVGNMVMEDNVRGGRSTMEMSGKSNAMSEINNLKGNPGFMEQLFNRNTTGHSEAKDRWERLHQIAFAEESA